ncbi:helix-turn-helix transcriptional regulator [Oenococcus sicerae]|uniref:helix-turn-helix transcriptional regulator n=1 Tax=Oenococcus sicerae TaxID=2203724 RepID=UPI0039ECD855
MSKKIPSFTAKKIKELRDEAGMSQGDVRKAFNALSIHDKTGQPINISNNSTVGNWEQGNNGVSELYIHGLAEIFHVTAYDLFYAEQPTTYIERFFEEFIRENKLNRTKYPTSKKAFGNKDQIISKNFLYGSLLDYFKQTDFEFLIAYYQKDELTNFGVVNPKIRQYYQLNMKNLIEIVDFSNFEKDGFSRDINNLILNRLCRHFYDKPIRIDIYQNTIDKQQLDKRAFDLYGRIAETVQPSLATAMSKAFSLLNKDFDDPIPMDELKKELSKMTDSKKTKTKLDLGINRVFDYLTKGFLDSIESTYYDFLNEDKKYQKKFPPKTRR